MSYFHTKLLERVRFRTNPSTDMAGVFYDRVCGGDAPDAALRTAASNVLVAVQR